MGKYNFNVDASEFSGNLFVCFAAGHRETCEQHHHEVKIILLHNRISYNFKWLDIVFNLFSMQR